MGYGDLDLFRSWEANLHGHELDQWQRVKGILEGATPEFRAAAMNLIFEAELQMGRSAWKDATAHNETYRAKLVSAAALEWKGRVRWLDEPMAKAVAASAALRDAAEVARDATLEALFRANVLKTVRNSFGRAMHSWGEAWEGAAKGRGITGFDNAQGVAAVKEEVAESRARRASTPSRRSRATEPEEAESGPGRTVAKVTGALFGKG